MAEPTQPPNSLGAVDFVLAGVVATGILIRKEHPILGLTLSMTGIAAHLVNLAHKLDQRKELGP